MRPKPRRGGKPAPRRRKRRSLGTLLFLVGLFAVLGGTFAAGALAGRFSFRPSASMASAKSVERVSKPAPSPPPELTFYRELTAPLTPPPPPPKPPAKPAARREGTTPPAPEWPEAGRYTVQVGSYNARAQAEAMRARLTAAGHDAYVAEGEAGGVMRYRVRIGAFTTGEEARQAAVRVASQAQVTTYVTTR